MDDRQGSPERPSLLKQQLSILYADPADLPAAQTQAEAARIEAYALPALKLQRQPTPAIVRWAPRRVAATLGLLCIAAFTVVTLRRNDDLTVKGLSSARVYWERGGAVRELAAGDTLASGDGVRAEVTVTKAGIAFQMMIDRSGTELVPDAVERQALRLAAGERSAFPGFRLVDPAQGERLIVGLCPEGPVSKALKALRAQVKGSEVAVCEVWEFSLR